MNPRWFGPHVAYTIAKYGMSMCVLGMAEEFRKDGIAVNALWPRTTIATAALQIIPGARPEAGRTPEIMADAAHIVLTRDSRSLTGRFLLDEEVLREAGVTDFEHYAVKRGETLRIDLFLDERR
jgi:citronellol/citronellal dehydrogenase